MTVEPLVPSRDDVFVLIESLEILSDKIQEEIDDELCKFYLEEQPDNRATAIISSLTRTLEDVALVRGRLQPYVEDILDEEAEIAAEARKVNPTQESPA